MQSRFKNKNISMRVFNRKTKKLSTFYIRIWSCFCVLISLGNILFAQEKNNNEVIDKQFIRSLIKDSDLILRVTVQEKKRDLCTVCTSTGNLYILKCRVKKIYFDRTKSVTHDKFIKYSTGADIGFFSKDRIIFLNNVSKKKYNTQWNAKEFTEFIFDERFETAIKYVIKKIR